MDKTEAYRETLGTLDHWDTLPRGKGNFSSPCVCTALIRDGESEKRWRWRCSVWGLLERRSRCGTGQRQGNDGSDTLVNWLDEDMAIFIAPENIITRQPVYIPNMMELMPMTPQTKALMRTIPNSSAWLINPDWKECDMFTFAMNA